jgi:fumarate hydratase subunit alpha
VSGKIVKCVMHLARAQHIVFFKNYRIKMREIKTNTIRDHIASLCIESNYVLADDVVAALKQALSAEESTPGRDILQQIIENASIAQQGVYPMCQDTGSTVVFVEIGQEVHIAGGSLAQAITEGVRQGYLKGYLRSSIVSDPLRRSNTGDNTPPVIWTEIVTGDRLKMTVVPKGAGCENMSKIAMLKPTDGFEGIQKFVLDCVRKAGGNTCPPLILGLGIGGTFEKAAWLAKKSLLRPVGERHEDEFYAGMEINLLHDINNLGIGPMGLGGRMTALDVHIEVYPCHIASLPVAVNFQCHAARHKSVII